MCEDFWWSTGKLEEMVELYRGNPCLYDALLPDYHVKRKRQRALRDIAQRLGTTEDEVSRKIRNLRTVYSKKKREGKSRLGGDTGCDASRQTWWLLPRLEFLDDFVCPKKTVSNVSSSSSLQVERVDNQSSHDRGEKKRDGDRADPPTPSANITDITHSMDTSTHSAECTPRRPQYPKPRCRDKGNAVAAGGSQLMESAMRCLEAHSARLMKEDDEYDVFGRFIANELRSLPETERRRLKYKLLAALRDAQSPAAPRICASHAGHAANATRSPTPSSP
ncbi:uncharacterized protein LOC116955721 [Petromyzon marinus]|nr:uncharacterized protein LOC116955721 isoform X2 [Petromyzon marinus]